MSFYQQIPMKINIQTHRNNKNSSNHNNTQQQQQQQQTTITVKLTISAYIGRLTLSKMTKGPLTPVTVR
jgi:hypothetical protein